MSKPRLAWQETWEFVSGEWPHGVYRVGDTGPHSKIADVWGGYGCEGAQLIAAAPEMARMLLRDYEENKLRCEPDCELIRVLSKAGVLPTSSENAKP